MEKKILPKYFQAVREEKKNFELRKDEDDVQPGGCPDLNGVGKRRIHWPDRSTPDPVCAPGCTGIWTDARLLYHRMVKE